MKVKEKLLSLCNEYLQHTGSLPKTIYMPPSLFEQFASELTILTRLDTPATAIPHDEDEDDCLSFKSAKVYARADCPPDSIQLLPRA